jgi:hypothetical protein
VTGLPPYLTKPLLREVVKLQGQVVRGQHCAATAHIYCMVLAKAADQLSQQGRNPCRIPSEGSQTWTRRRAKCVGEHHHCCVLGQRAEPDPDGAVAFEQAEQMVGAAANGARAGQQPGQRLPAKIPLQ